MKFDWIFFNKLSIPYCDIERYVKFVLFVELVASLEKKDWPSSKINVQQSFLQPQEKMKSSFKPQKLEYIIL